MVFFKKKEKMMKMEKCIIFLSIVLLASSCISVKTAAPKTAVDKALTDAVISKDYFKVKNLLDSGANPNIINRNGDSLVYFAARNNDVDIIKLLVESGAEVTTINKNGNTPLHEAVKKGRKDAVELLLHYGAKSVSNNKEQTPYDLAIEMEIEGKHGSSEVVDAFTRLSIH
jgi:uncharacterized protein